MTGREMIEQAQEGLGEIRVPMALFWEIGKPILETIARLQEGLEALDAEKEEAEKDV